MTRTRGTFAKRNRETKLKDKARAKDERRAARAAAPPGQKGPQIAWDEAVTEIDSSLPPAAPVAPPEVSVPPQKRDP